MLLINPFWHVLSYWSFYLLILALNYVFLFCISQIWLAISVFTSSSYFYFIILVSSFLAPEGTFTGETSVHRQYYSLHYFPFGCIDFPVTVIKENVTAKNVTTPSFIINYEFRKCFVFCEICFFLVWDLMCWCSFRSRSLWLHQSTSHFLPLLRFFAAQFHTLLRLKIFCYGKKFY